MEITKPLTMREFLEFDKITWEETDYIDGTHYKRYIYPEQDETNVETLVYDRSWKQISSEDIDTNGIFKQLNNAIKRSKESGEKITGNKKATMNGRITQKPKTSMCKAAEDMLGKLPRCDIGIKEISEIPRL